MRGKGKREREGDRGGERASGSGDRDDPAERAAETTEGRERLPAALTIASRASARHGKFTALGVGVVVRTKSVMFTFESRPS